MSREAGDQIGVRSASPPLTWTLAGAAVAAQAYRVSADTLTRVIRDLRAGGCRLALVLDGRDGIPDLDALAAEVDVLSFSTRRRGFGVARSSALAAARLMGASGCILLDADGMHAAAPLDAMLARIPPHAAAALPQRSRIHLNLDGGGRVNRSLAERFDNYCAACAAGRPDRAFHDLQPGLLVLGPAAADLLAGEMRSRGYSWDLEAAWRLLRSGLSVAFPPIESYAAAQTSFTEGDSRELLRFLVEELGVDAVRASLERFRAEPRPRREFGDEAVEAHAAFVRGALAG